jgi:diguanylate cyclase (GGDEF)-like protein/PAS domain S-box-containing protein
MLAADTYRVTGGALMTPEDGNSGCIPTLDVPWRAGGAENFPLLRVVRELLLKNGIVLMEWELAGNAFKVVAVSDGIRNFGINKEMLEQGTRPLEWYILSEDAPLYFRRFAAVSDFYDDYVAEYRIKKPGYGIMSIRDHRVRCATQPGKFWGVISDISELKRMEEENERCRQQYDSLVNNISEYIYCVYYHDGKPAATFHNPYCEKITGWSQMDFFEDRSLWYTMIYPEDRKHVLEALEKIEKNHEPFSIEHRIVHREGSIRWISNSCVALLDNQGDLVQLNGFIIDLTRRHVKEEQLTILADTDPLTGALNRRAGLVALKAHLETAALSGIPFSVCFIDVDRLKQVNDECGHSEGDVILKNVVTAIRLATRQNDVVVRLGGDEFVILLAGCTADQAREIGITIDRHLSGITTISSQARTVSVSKGIVQFDPLTMPTSEKLLALADELMYREKQRKRNQ